MTREEAHKLIDHLFDIEHSTSDPTEGLDTSGVDTTTAETTMRILPEGKRVVRTKSSGDRVYYLDEEQKTRHWVTNPEVLQGLGFESSDVVEIEDNELLKYQMSSAIYKVPNATT